MAIDSTRGFTGLGYVYWKTGRRDEAQKMFARALKSNEEQLEQGNEDHNVPYDVARIKAVLGNKAEAYKWLQKAIDSGWRMYYVAEVDPFLEGLRGDDRFKRMMADVKARVDEMRKRIDEMDKE
jgi:tetratricopeptide (TPR) repeat protein